MLDAPFALKRHSSLCTRVKDIFAFIRGPEAVPDTKRVSSSVASRTIQRSVNLSTILNGFHVCFGEDHGILEIEENEIEVNEHSSNIADVPELAELLEKFAVIHDENCDGSED